MAQSQQEIKAQMEIIQRSDRVKCVDLHPSKPWILSAMHTGNVCIWNYETKTLVKSVQVSEGPVRSAKFIAQKDWIVCGSDDGRIRVYDYSTDDDQTMKDVQVVEAHSDYIRCVAVHPTLPLVLSASDDKLIRLWDWDKNWTCVQTFQGHAHYVMQVAFNPKLDNVFSSASLDRTIKVWSIGSTEPSCTLEGHEKGVNCVDYGERGEKGTYIISGSDDHSVKVWDEESKTCIQTLEGHKNNVTAVCFHPNLPIILSAAEDNTLSIWNATTYSLEQTIDSGLQRAWAIGYLKGATRIVLGYDEGTGLLEWNDGAGNLNYLID